MPIKPQLITFLMVLFFVLGGTTVFSQANITIEVSWGSWSSENRVTFRDPADTQIGASICNPGACFNGSGNNSYNNTGSLASYPAVAFGNNYDILLEDTYGDGWNGTSYVRVYQDGVLIASSDLTGGSSSVVSFNIQQLPSSLVISDVAVDEDAGTADFTVMHSGGSSPGPYTVNFETVAGTATSGIDYTPVVGGILNFDGTSGDTESISIAITDDTLYESSETFTIQFTASSEATLDISNTAVGTIVDNEIVLGDTPLTLFEELDGYIDYASTGGSLRDQPNGTNACSTVASSSNTLTSTIPLGAVVEKAILYWTNSGAMDTRVTFEGVQIDAELVYRTTIIGLEFHNQSADVTAMLQAMPDPTSNTFDFSGLTIDSSGSYCSSSVTLGGWALMVFYSAPGLPASTINLYQGFDGSQNATTSFGLSGFYAIGSTGAKTTILSWEGDQSLANNESLQFNTPLTGNNTLIGDGDNTGGTNPFNSTIFDNVGVPSTNDATQYGVDLDTYNVSALILPGETAATTVVNVGQDFVAMNAVVLKVPSNIVVGTVFEDVNYGGGVGRDLITSGGVGIPNATVELYDNLGALLFTTTTDATGQYTFAGMANGTYTARVVNSLVPSTRPNGNTCTTCMPVQTFKADYVGSAIIPEVNLVGGNTPSVTDPAAGILVGAQSTGTITIFSEGAVGIDFGFNFNTIVNTNEDGQGSLEQFLVNSNALDASGIDIEANGIFNPVAGDDTSIFMIPPTGDALGRTADANFTSGYFDISISNDIQLSIISDANTKIDGRTQTAYSGDTNAGTIGSGGTTVGVSANILPDYERPEIQVHRNLGDVIRTQGDLFELRNIAVYADLNAGVRIDGGNATLIGNYLGVNAVGVASGNIDYGVEIVSGASRIEGNYIAQNTIEGIYITGGTSTLIQENHITDNGVGGACFDNITITSGTGIVIRRNLIDRASSLGIDDESTTGDITISENTITNSGQDGGNCGGSTPENAGVKLDASNSSISNNIIASNGGAGIVLSGGSSNLISQNSIYANGTAADALGIDIAASGNFGDGVTINDTGDTDGGPNGSINFPVITVSFVAGTVLTVRGWARPGVTIEWFLTDINEGTATTGDNQLGLSNDYGEGQIYLGTSVEGSGADLDNTSSLYTDADGNTDTTNKFHFEVTIPPGIQANDLITSTATLANSTSEFSPFSIVKIPTIITNRRITYRVKKN